MRAGPKPGVESAPLPCGTGTGSVAFAGFCREYIVVPKGKGAGGPLILRPFQLDLVGSVLDRATRPRLAGWMLPRGQGKSTLLAALAVHELLLGGEGSSTVVVATDFRQAGLIFNIARRMVELNEHLSSRVQIFKDRLYVPATDSTVECLPAEPKRLEGLDPSLILLDEAGVADRATYEVLTLAQGKREASSLIAIGTPGPDPTDSVLTDLRNLHAELGDEYVVWREFSANSFQHHDVTCRHCWALANPAMSGPDPFLFEDAMVTLVRTTRENTFRRARLCQLVSDTAGEFLPAGCWASLSTGLPIPPGSRVVVSLDGSLSDDSCALVIGTIDTEPHFDVLALWEKPADDDTWRVPISEVEDAVRAARRDYRLVELVADPWGYSRTLHILESEGLCVSEFPWSPSRVTAATGDLYTAATNGKLTHSGDPRLAAHVGNAVAFHDGRGVRIGKANRSAHARKVDACAALLMCHSRATWHATHRKPTRYASFPV